MSKHLVYSMKSMKILICSLLFCNLIFTNKQGFTQNQAKEFSVHLGVFDFTGEAAREFYKIAPSIIMGTNLYKKKNISLKVFTGLSFASVRYNSRRHYLYLIPLNLIGVYTLTESNTQIQPYFGTGLGIYYKIDKNANLDKAHDSFTYGYILNAGFDFPLKKTKILTFDIKYHFVMPPTFEEINYGGIIPSIGIKIPLSHSSR